MDARRSHGGDGGGRGHRRLRRDLRHRDGRRDPLLLLRLLLDLLRRRQLRGLNLRRGCGRARSRRRTSSFFGVVNEVTSGAVRTKAGSVKRAAKFRLVLGMPIQVAQFVLPVSELALVAVFAGARFFKRSAQLSLVMRGDGIGGRCLGGGGIEAAAHARV